MGRIRDNGNGEATFRDPTARAVLINKAKKFGNNGLRKMQGSTIIKYHYLPIDGRTTFQFFKDVKNLSFPFTNLQENKLQVGEGMILERGYFSVMELDITPPTTPATIVDVNTIRANALGGFYGSLFSFFIANNQVIKEIPLSSFESNFNRYSAFQNNDVFRFDSDTSLQPLIEFTAQLQTGSYTPPAPEANPLFLGLTIEGRGSLLNPRTNF